MKVTEYVSRILEEWKKHAWVLRFSSYASIVQKIGQIPFICAHSFLGVIHMSMKVSRKIEVDCRYICDKVLKGLLTTPPYILSKVIEYIFTEG